jgi:hypothetical protein
MRENLQEYVGAVHIHTKYSDGSGELQEIVEAAREARLDFLVVSDHNSLGYLEDGGEGWHDDVLCLVGEEITHRTGHCVALGIRSPVSGETEPRKYLAAIRRQGGLSFIVHPHLSDKPKFRIKRCAWKDWNVRGFDGMEIWSFMTDWASGLGLGNLIARCRNPLRYIRGPFRQTLEKWDELARERRIVGVGGVDAHAKVVIPFGLVKIFPYAQVFKTLQTVVLCPALARNAEKAKETFYAALAAGHCYFANAHVGEPRGFRFFAELQSGDTLMQGDESTFFPGTVLKVTNPMKADIRIVCDGKIVAEARTPRFAWQPVSPGAYRAELRVGGAPFLFSNHIYLRTP